MALVTASLDRIARQCSITPPASWITAADDEHVELRDDFLADTADDILDRIDLPSPIGKQYTLPTDGSETYNLPSDFNRLMRDRVAVYETTTQRRPLIPISGDGLWTHLKEIGSTGVERYYRLGGYEGARTIDIYDLPASNINIVVNYVSDLWLQNGGSFKSAFTDPNDEFILPRRVLEAGTIWRWRERKGFPFQDKYNEYELLISRLSNDSRPRRTVSMGDTPKRMPWDVPVPDFIPSS